MFTHFHLYRFKKFTDQTVPLAPHGVTLVAGGNNSGKSSLLHGMAVWEFCKTVINAEKGARAFLPGSRAQGLGLSGEEFSPINVPSLRHLWTNLDFHKRGKEFDGYTLRLRGHWNTGRSTRSLEFGLSLANDRLFVKTTDSNLASEDAIPTVAYLPPFAGMTDRETRVPVALRRRRIGEGLAGAVMRNILLDLYQANQKKRQALRGNRNKLSDADLRKLRTEDPWELLQETMRQTFSTELSIAPFSEEYHSYIRVDVAKGTILGRKLKRYPNYKNRDVMVEGSGFLQWLSVYALAANPSINILLLDEPDAHLHPSLQDELMRHLNILAEKTQKQVLVATHSSDLLRQAMPESILEMNEKRGPRFLAFEEQKVEMLSGMGSEYAPKIDRIKKTKHVLFVEGTSDHAILSVLGKSIGKPIDEKWIPWITSSDHKERKQIFLALRSEIPELHAISLRDRDVSSIESVDEQLNDRSVRGPNGFIPIKWKRRHIESYLLNPKALARACGKSVGEVESKLRDDHGLALGDSYCEHEVPQGLLDVNGKNVIQSLDINAHVVAEAVRPEEIPVDVITFLTRLDEAI